MLQLTGPSGDDQRTVSLALLEGTEYVLTWTWNELLEAWYLDVTSSGGVDLVSGVRVVAYWPLLNEHTITVADLPQGVLMVVSMSADHSDPGRYDLAEGGRCRLVYITRAEALAMREEGEAVLRSDLQVSTVEA